MLEFKVIRLVQALLNKELSTVERYLSSPHVTSNQECAQLFVQICKFHPEMDSPKLTKERLFAKLFVKQPYNDGKMRKLMTQLTQAIEQYLMEAELKKSEELRAKLLARALSERNNYKLFSEAVLSRLKVLENGVGRGRDYFRESYELSEMLYFHPGSDKLNKRNEYLVQAIFDFERYFTIVMLQNQADNIVRSRLVHSHDISHYLEITKKVSEKPAFATSNAIVFFKHILDLLQGEIEENIDQLRMSSLEIFGKLSRFEQDFAINLLRSYAVPMANKGSLPHKRFIFDLFKLELERGFFADTISAGAFMNIVSVGLGVDEFDWVDNFVVNYNQYLPADESEITTNYCQGLLNYQKGLRTNKLEHFYNAILCMNLIPTRTGAKFDIRVRPSMLRIHFEILERKKETLDDLLMQTKNFERHLNGSGLYSDKVRTSHLKFLSYFRMLARITGNPNLKKPEVVKFLEKLNNDIENIAQKPWLLEKAKGLIKED